MEKVIIVLQARVSSTRLPCKVLLPLHDIPLVILAAKRAGNTGRKVIVATSEDTSDDILVNSLQRWSIDYVRGSLQNVLYRLVNNLTHYDDDTIIVRLTADNVLPDGLLIDEIIEDFKKRNLNYITSSGETTGLPYGVSVEVTKLFHLREALVNSRDAYEQEHVTPYIIKKYGRTLFKKYRKLKMEGYRCTIDTFTDYLFMANLFDKLSNAVDITFLEICHLISNYSNTTPSNNHKLVLGTAQLGMNYGINNATGKPTQNIVNEIIHVAIDNGVTNFDTANAYGESETVLGKALSTFSLRYPINIITKLSPLNLENIQTNENILNTFVESSIYNSLIKLKQNQLSTLLLHRANHLDEWQGLVWKRLIKFQEEGVIDKLGVSVQTPAEAIRALQEPYVSLIQLPYNLLDNRWSSAIDMIKSVKNERSLLIHVRSIFLQGLLLSNDNKLWQKANISDYQAIQIQQWLDNMVEKMARKNRADLLLAFINGLDWIDGIVIGVETVEQILMNIELMSYSPLELDSINFIIDNRPKIGEQSLNPAQWR